jgi:hypothetical protein
MPRTLRRWAAWVAVTVFLGAFLLPLASVHVGDPDVAESISLAPSHPVEQFEAVHPPVRGDHCALCHWLRDISGLSPGTTASSGAWLEPVAVKAPAPVPQVESPAVFGRSSRAPPALS